VHADLHGDEVRGCLRLRIAVPLDDGNKALER